MKSPPAVPDDIRLVGGLLTSAALRAPDRTAIVSGAGDATWSYADLDAVASRFARALIAAGIAPGERIAIMARNVPEYAAVYFGAARAGAVLVNLLTAYAPDETRRILEKTGARLVVAEAPFADAVAAVLAGLDPAPPLVVIGGGEGHADFAGFVAPHPAADPALALAETDPVAITFTGGTTGFPKGAVVSHRARLMSARLSIAAHGLGDDEVIGVVSPMFHAIALLVWYQSAVMLAAPCWLQPRWDAGGFIDAVARHGVTAALMVPAQIRAVLDHPDFGAARLAGLGTVVSGGAALPAALADRFRAALPGVALVDDFGQSETGPLTVLRSEDMPAKTGTIGRVVDGVEVALVDPDGRPVAPGEIGEIVSRGDHLMSGYFDDPAETAAYFRQGDGWGWTGDLGRLDADGFITLAGRSKEMIVSGGENVYPREVELAIEAHPGVAECAAVGIADEKWGEALAAFVIAAPGAALDAEAVRDWCAGRLARFKRPARIVFVDSLPRTGAGKVRKAELAARLAADG